MESIVFAFGAFGCAGITALREAGFSIAAVYTHAEAPEEASAGPSVADLCARLGLPVYRFEGQAAAATARIQALAPDYIFSFYFRALLPEPLLACAKKGAFNLHGSLLPKYRGRAPLNWALLHGETETGVTLHHMTARADAGDIVAQARVAIAYEDDAARLQGKLLAAAETLLRETLPVIAAGAATRRAQDLTQGCYCGRRRPEDGRIDWTQDAEAVRNLVRAVTRPFPGAFTFAGGRRVMLWKVTVVPGAGAAGEVLSAVPPVVACGRHAVRVDDGDAAGLRVGELLA